ncbi:MAG TPA: efflux RND transporter periplasmic adaptor subunit [bacterium]|nr:efflux RND transporter periplasmic adaptor subunit [bacterium]
MASWMRAAQRSIMSSPPTGGVRPPAAPQGRRGGWQRWRPVCTLVLVALALAGCAAARGRGQDPRAAAPPPPSVVVVEAIRHTVPIYSENVAQTVAVQIVDLRAQIGGTLEQVLFKEGAEVKRGQLLFVIDQRPYAAALQATRAQLATAQANLRQALEQVQLAQAKAQQAALQATLVNAQKQVERDRYLVAQQAVAQQQLDNDTAAEQAAAANVAAQEAVVKNTALSTQIGIEQARAGVQQVQAAVTQAELNLRYTLVRAPIDGTVGLLSVDQGNLVAANAELATMSSVDPIVAQFRLSEVTFLGLVKRTSAEAARTGSTPLGVPSFQLVLADGSTYAHPGTFRTLDRAVDPQTGTIVVQALFPNPERLLRPGMFARVRAKLQDRPNAVLVPQVAVQEVQGVKTVFVVAPDNSVLVRSLEDGGPYGQFFVVLNGLRAGDRVIVEGVQKVRPGIKVTPTLRPAPALPGPNGRIDPWEVRAC